MAELQNILSGLNGQQKLNDMELDASYVPTQAQDVMTKSVHDAALVQVAADIATAVAGNQNHDVDGGTF